MKDEPVETIEYRGKRIRIYQDLDNGDGPRDCENFGTMVCFSSRYTLGDVENPGVPEDYLRYLAGDCGTPIETDNCSMTTIHKILNRHYLMLSLYLYDHSGITMRCRPFSCPWDGGQIGWIHVSHAKIRENWSVKCVRHKVKSHTGKRIKAIDYARQVLEGEVETYDQFLTGDVYGYVVGEDGDSCWGFYGHNWKENGLLEAAQDAIDCEIRKKIKDHLMRLKAWLLNKVPLNKREPLEV